MNVVFNLLIILLLLPHGVSWNKILGSPLLKKNNSFLVKTSWEQEIRAIYYESNSVLFLYQYSISVDMEPVGTWLTPGIWSEHRNHLGIWKRAIIMDERTKTTNSKCRLYCNRVHRLEIQSAMLVTPLVYCCPSTYLAVGGWGWGAVELCCRPYSAGV